MQLQCADSGKLRLSFRLYAEAPQASRRGGQLIKWGVLFLSKGLLQQTVGRRRLTEVLVIRPPCSHVAKSAAPRTCPAQAAPQAQTQDPANTGTAF